MYFLAALGWKTQKGNEVLSSNGGGDLWSVTFSKKNAASVLRRIMSSLMENSCIRILKYLTSLVRVR